MAIPQEDYLGITDYKVVGTRPVRHDGADKVTGRAIYGTDLNLPDMLHGRVLRSPHAHARIKSIDTSKAEALEGVRAVVTGQDLALNAEEQLADLGEEVVRVKDMCAAVLAREKVLYQGYPVAAVAATNVHIAEEALDLIEVEYEVLPHVLDVREAMKDDAPLVHEDQRTNSMGERSENFSNVASHFRTELGDIEQGFAESDVTRRARVSHGYGASGLYRATECHGVVECRWRGDDLVQQSGCVWRAGSDCENFGHSRVAN